MCYVLHYWHVQLFFPVIKNNDRLCYLRWLSNKSVNFLTSNSWKWRKFEYLQGKNKQPSTPMALYNECNFQKFVSFCFVWHKNYHCFKVRSRGEGGGFYIFCLGNQTTLKNILTTDNIVSWCNVWSEKKVIDFWQQKINIISAPRRR